MLNRMGQNILVFDFIRESTARDILDGMIAVTLEDLARQDITVTLTPDARLFHPLSGLHLGGDTWAVGKGVVTLASPIERIETWLTVHKNFARTFSLECDVQCTCTKCPGPTSVIGLRSGA
jgi:hypothetical protein